MGESTKAVCGLLIIVAIFAAALAWISDRPDAMIWGIRVGAPIGGLLVLGLLHKLQTRADLEPDYLRRRLGTYFNRRGFCFGFVMAASDGVAFLDTYFQNQYDQPCLGRIVLRPARGFFLTRSNIEAITFEIECPPAGFGRARLPLPIPSKLQGRRQTFEVGASVQYPQGKGRRVRFHDGVFLRSISNFGTSFGRAIAKVGAVTGTITLTTPATVKVALPAGVLEKLPGDIPPAITMLWQRGDPPPPAAA